APVLVNGSISPLSTTTNGGKSTYQGIELDAQQSLDTRYGAFSLYGNISVNKAYFSSAFSLYPGAAMVNPGMPLTYRPQHLANIGAGWHLGSWRAEANLHYASSQYLPNLITGL
ncbi:hypothetical protein B1A_05629, partial [mine drainage metagenome]